MSEFQRRSKPRLDPALLGAEGGHSGGRQADCAIPQVGPGCLHEGLVVGRASSRAAASHDCRCCSPSRTVRRARFSMRSPSVRLSGSRRRGPPPLVDGQPFLEKAKEEVLKQQLIVRSIDPASASRSNNYLPSTIIREVKEAKMFLCTPSLGRTVIIL